MRKPFRKFPLSCIFRIGTVIYKHHFYICIAVAGSNLRSHDFCDLNGASFAFSAYDTSKLMLQKVQKNRNICEGFVVLINEIWFFCKLISFQAELLFRNLDRYLEINVSNPQPAA